MPLPKEDKIYTYADYIEWPENERIELINGRVYLMTSPSRIHQKTLGKIFYQFANYLKDKSCEVYMAPFDVRFPDENEEDEDKLHKFNLYEKHGVKEYWIVEPENKILNVFILQENKRYGRPEIYTQDDKVKVSIFEDLMSDLKDIF
ncbi:MAG: Uma2 family endonuclease [Thermovenabulum sp.]|uniref:Uma2 family endonuclease n=1 Tax=Thermovenabulum sp. TaxID=3100335 RepID=UPI003C7DD399